MVCMIRAQLGEKSAISPINLLNRGDRTVLQKFEV